jgi:anti-anti-sigma factor
MSVQITPKADFLVVEFGHDLTIFTVRDCYEALKKLAALAMEKVILDLSAVNDFDSSGVQLVLWLIQQHPDKNFTLTHSDNPAVSRVFQLYSLDFGSDAQATE